MQERYRDVDRRFDDLDKRLDMHDAMFERLTQHLARVEKIGWVAVGVIGGTGMIEAGKFLRTIFSP